VNKVLEFELAYRILIETNVVWIATINLGNNLTFY